MLARSADDTLLRLLHHDYKQSQQDDTPRMPNYVCCIGSWVGFLRSVPYKAARGTNVAKNSESGSPFKGGLVRQCARALQWKMPLLRQIYAQSLENRFEGGLGLVYQA